MDSSPKPGRAATATQPRRASKLEARLAALLLRIAPFVSVSDSSSPDRIFEGGPVLDPRSDPATQARHLWFGVHRAAAKDIEQVRETLAEVPGARIRWGPLSREQMLAGAVASLAFEAAGPDETAAALADHIGTTPPEHIAVAPISGIRLEVAGSVGGVELRANERDSLVMDLGLSAERAEALSALAAPEAAGVLAVSRCQADPEVALAVLRDRFRAVLPLVLLARPDEDIDWFYESTVTFGPAAVHAVAVGPERTALHPIGGDAARSEIVFDGARVNREISRRGGLARVARLAPALPERPRTKVDRRLLRAAIQLGESFEGTFQERLLRRWIAMEALLGDTAAELSDRLCERLAVITHPDAPDRLERKRGLKELYRYRSAVAHGEEPAELPEHQLTWFRLLSHVALETVADLAVETDEELFEAVDRAKFEARSIAARGTSE